MRKILAVIAGAIGLIIAAILTLAGCSSAPSWCGYAEKVIHHQTTADGIAARLSTAGRTERQRESSHSGPPLTSSATTRSRTPAGSA